MSDAGEPSVYRIERHGAGVLHLYRGGDLVDIDQESDGDTRDDIERWGSGVAWAEDYTGIERWDAADNADGQWRTLVGVPFRYVTWQWEGVFVWNETDSAGWATRHIEATHPDGNYTAAASLEQVIAAWDTGGIEAVRAYETVYGVVPEAPLPDDEPALVPISGYEFVQRWITARSELGRDGQSPLGVSRPSARRMVTVGGTEVDDSLIDLAAAQLSAAGGPAKLTGTDRVPARVDQGCAGAEARPRS